MKKFLLPLILLVGLIPLFSGCAPLPTNTDNGWITYEVRDGLSFGDAWNIVVDIILSHDYQFETIVRDDGYMKSEWKYETVPDFASDVRTRIAVKFTYGRKTVRIKYETEYLTGEAVPGLDIPRVADIKEHIRDQIR